MIFKKFKEKRLVAREALFFIKDKQIVGLGSGSTMKIFVKLLAWKVRKEKLNINVVPSSEKILKLCKKYRLKIINNPKKINIAIDGADKIDNKFNISKGFGAFAFVDEKKIDYMADKCVIIADSSKFVKNILDYDILISSKKIPKSKFIEKKIEIKSGIYKIRISNKIKDISNLENELGKIGKNGLFTKFKELLVVGVENGKVFINPREKFLQVAIDIADEKKALQIIKKTSKYVDIIEIGTPLIEFKGVGIIKKLKKYDNLILADIKAADAGSYETKVAINSGADIASILAGSSDNTIQEAVKIAHDLGKKVLVDLIDIKNQERIKRLKEILSLKYKPDIICVHTAIDVQKNQDICNSDVNDFIKLCKKENVLVALAGGIDKNKIRKLIKYKPDIFIVGGAITKSKQPGKAARELNEVAKLRK